MKRNAAKNLEAPGGCPALGDGLVDCADGELSPAAAARAERHLAECDACRSEAAALTRSLALAQSIWADAAYETAPAQAADTRKVRPWRIAAAVAGVATMVAVVVGGYLATRPAAERSIAAGTREQADSGGDLLPADDVPLGELDIEALIQRREQSARLAASVQFLTTLPVDREDAQRAELYLRESYGVE